MTKQSYQVRDEIDPVNRDHPDTPRYNHNAATRHLRVIAAQVQAALRARLAVDPELLFEDDRASRLYGTIVQELTKDLEREVRRAWRAEVSQAREVAILAVRSALQESAQ
jgi:hypothetical protein